MYHFRSEERLNKIFSLADSRSLCIACDHGLMVDPTFSWMNINTVVHSAVVEKADALLLSAGQIRRFSGLFSGKHTPGLIVRTDWINLLRVDDGTPKANKFLPVKDLQFRRLIGAKEALYDLGAAACIGFLLEDPGGKFESITLKACSELVVECHQIGMPCIIEVIPVRSGEQPFDADRLIQRGSWLAAEIGADLVKIPFTGNSEAFAKLLQEIDIKVLVLGGSNIADEDRFLGLMDQVLQLGAHGLIIGRNVSNSQDPNAMIQRLRKLVHPIQQNELMSV